MPYDEALSDRMRRVLGPRPDISEKMFWGTAFLRDGKNCACRPMPASLRAMIR